MREHRYCWLASYREPTTKQEKEKEEEEHDNAGVERWDE